mgnify:FL=1
MHVPEVNLDESTSVCKEYGRQLRRAGDNFLNKKLYELDRLRRAKNMYQIATFSLAAIFVGGIIWRWLKT